MTAARSEDDHQRQRDGGSVHSADRVRQWFAAQADGDVVAITRACPELQRVGGRPVRGGMSSREERRAVGGVRKRIAGAPDADIEQITRSLLGGVRRELIGQGRAAAIVDAPDADQLESMLLDLPRPVAVMAFFGLMMGQHPQSKRAAETETRLTGALGLDPTEADADHVPVPVDLTWHAIEATVRELGDRSDLVDRLHRAGRAVSAGRQLPDADETASHLVEYGCAIRTLLADVAQLDPAGDQVTDLDGVRAAVKQAMREADELRVRRAGLLAARAQVAELLAGASSHVASGFQAALADFDRQLADLPNDTIDPPTADAASGGSRDLNAAPDEGTTAVDTQAASSEAAPPGPVENDGGHGAIDAAPAEPSLGAAGLPDDEPLAINGSGGGEVRASAATQQPPAPTTVPGTAELTAEPDAVTSELAERAAFPWESGSPPPVVELVRQERFVEAYWVTAASDESPARAQVIALAAAAFDATDANGAGGVLLDWDVPLDALGRDHDAGMAAAAALLRCGLTAGWCPHYLPVEELCANLSDDWAELVRCASMAVHLRCQIAAHPVGGGAPTDDPGRERAELSRAVQKLRADLPQRKIKYQRATRVLQHLLRPGQPLGAMLDGILAWAESGADLQVVRVEVGRLAHDVGRVIDQADAEVFGPKRRGPIEAGALEKLKSTITDVLDRGREAITIAERLDGPRAGAPEAAGLLRQAARAVRGQPVPAGVGGAVLGRLRDWILEPGDQLRHGPAATRVTLPSAEMPVDALLVLPDLPRDRRRRPDLSSPGSRIQLSALIGEPDPAAAVSAYLDRGAVDLARRLIDVTGLAESGYDAPMKEARERCGGKVDRHRRAVEALLDTVRFQDLLPTGDIATISGRLDDRGNEERGAFDLATAELDELRHPLQRAFDERLRILRADVAGVGDPDLQEQIRSLLDAGDTITANELIALDRDHESLPEHPADATAELAEFLAAVAENASADAQQWADAFRPADAPPVVEATSLQLESWARLSDQVQSDDRDYLNAVQSVLRLLGLDTVQSRLQVTRGPRKIGVRSFEATVASRDGAYVPELGSEARGRFRILVISDDRRGRSLLDDIDVNSVDVPHVVLYLRAMSRAMRGRLADEARARQANAIVVDPAVVGWIAARAPGSFRATQRLTLPWSGYVPYRPAGLVPSEVFVGREKERRAVVAPNGGIFVYGGRQLGKSALLRQIEAEPGDQRLVVYLDLKALGIGEAERPEQIWVVLAAELNRLDVLSARVSQPNTIVREIQRWLDADENRHLLVLADESDSFLTADGQGVATPGGQQHFPNMMRLKQLMEASGRRFKVVFAGLHQVQRFRHLSNVPTPQGGQEILIGPLDPSSAMKLVVEPMAALGYRFERREVVLRLLAATNYQPAPIQIFCMELLAHMRARHRGSEPVPVTITADDVGRVASDREVRDRIAKLARITIDLEDRYRVLALLIASKSLADAFSRAYPLVELLDEAQGVWLEGFASIDESALAVYLDEMEGLGLLTRSRDRSGYAVRSPNVVGMLGTRDDFNRELNNSVFTLPYEYNPRFARRQLGVDGDTNAEQRSPLTDAQLEGLVTRAKDRARRRARREPGPAPVIVGSAWLTIDRVPDALRRFLDGKGGEPLRVVRPAEVGHALTEAVRGKDRWIVADLRGAERDAVLHTIGGNGAGMPIVVVIGPDEAQFLSDDELAECVRPVRWTVDSIRAWHECPFETPEQRQELITATGGWPILVERTNAEAKRHDVTRESAIKHVNSLPLDRDEALVVLDGIGIDAATAEVAAQWALLTPVDRDGQIEPIPQADLGEILDLAPDAARRFVHRLDLLGVLTVSAKGISLDEVTHRCLTRAHAAP